MNDLRVLGSAALLLLASCASPAALGVGEGRSGAEVLIRPDDAGITLDAAGASRLTVATGCRVEFLSMATTTLGLFRVWETDAKPAIDDCVASLRSVPGVSFVEINFTASSSRGVPK